MSKINISVAFYSRIKLNLKLILFVKSLYNLLYYNSQWYYVYSVCYKVGRYLRCAFENGLNPNSKISIQNSKYPKESGTKKWGQKPKIYI